MVSIGGFFSFSVAILFAWFVCIFVIFHRVIYPFRTLHQKIDPITNRWTYFFQSLLYIFFVERCVGDVDCEFFVSQSACGLVHIIQVIRIDIENTEPIAYLRAELTFVITDADWTIQDFSLFVSQYARKTL